MQAMLKSGTLGAMDAPDNATSSDATELPLENRSSPTSTSAFARFSLLVYTLLIVYASWYPFSGWRDMGLQPFDYLWARLPYYWTGFDLWTNIVGYAPFGALLVYSLYPRLSAQHRRRCCPISRDGGGANLLADARLVQSGSARQ